MGLAALSLNNSSQIILSIPGDTVHISVKTADGIDSAEKLALTFSGKTKALQEYYPAKQAQLPELKQRIWSLGMNTSDLKLFQQSAGSALKQEKLFLKQYSLPDWF